MPSAFGVFFPIAMYGMVYVSLFAVMLNNLKDNRLYIKYKALFVGIILLVSLSPYVFDILVYKKNNKHQRCSFLCHH